MDFNMTSTKPYQTYIAASYVKFVESAGGRVVPVHYDSPTADLRKIFHQVNGLIFPGGGTSIRKVPGNQFRKASEFLYDLALKANDAGDSFPIHGTCLGFQMLSVLAAGDDGVLCAKCYDTEGTPLPLDLTPAAKSSKLFSAMPADLMKALVTQNLTENSHVSGFQPKTFADNANLKKFFRVLSTNTDGNGSSFVSTIEAVQYPISGTHWHPEKNNFEWGQIGKLGYKAIPHSAPAVLLSQYMANNFVSRARKSRHGFASVEAEQKALISNFPTVSDPQGYFSQIYLWERSGQDKSALIV
jgi:gamma-glutamyl hydrolase